MCPEGCRRGCKFAPPEHPVDAPPDQHSLSVLGVSGETPGLTVHGFDLSEQLRVVGISAEPCWEYAHLVERIFPGKTIWL